MQLVGDLLVECFLFGAEDWIGKWCWYCVLGWTMKVQPGDEIQGVNGRTYKFTIKGTNPYEQSMAFPASRSQSPAIMTKLKGTKKSANSAPSFMLKLTLVIFNHLQPRKRT
jgi:hypothetical protein